MRHRAFVVSGLIASMLLAGCPDRNSPERQLSAAVARFEAFTNQMCACKDKACADKVQADMTAWSAEMAKSAPKDSRPDEAMVKKMTELGTRYGECLTKLMSVAPEIAAPPVRDDVPPASTTRDADTLLREARSWARAKRPGHVIKEVTLDYVDARGVLDETHGEAVIVFGRTRPVPDDRNRKIGAPVEHPAMPDDCFQLTWTPSDGWDRTGLRCLHAPDVVNRCTLVDIWKKAIARGAPGEGLARLNMWPTDRWSFKISDEPRGIDISESFPDDCPLVVEK